MSAIILLMALSIGLQATAQPVGMYMFAVDNGAILRMDTRTGVVTRCSKEGKCQE